MSITLEQENSERMSSPQKLLVGGRIATYEFLLNDSPLIDDNFLKDRSWIPFRELDECDEQERNKVIVRPFNVN
jgi:hypothetical protein